MALSLRAPRAPRGAERPHASLASSCVGGGLEGLCYPPGLPGCLRVVASLEASGVYNICSLLGKGHASVVALAYTRWGLRAVKVRRLDSRRESLAWEGSALERAWRLGASPRPYYVDDNVIVMEYVEGPLLGEALEDLGLTPQLVSEALDAARSLDAGGILHLELHRPWRNIVYTGTGRAYIIDLDSHTEGCGNVARLLSGLARLHQRLLMEVRRGVLRGELRAYVKKGCPRGSYDTIKNLVLEVIGLSNFPDAARY
ncbi:MAG: hypothetical protein F7B17_06310 [Desulfurococcales archaeon]|nr:hypothetical protein [Desulfurococcales archaeon]